MSINLYDPILYGDFTTFSPSGDQTSTTFSTHESETLTKDDGGDPLYHRGSVFPDKFTFIFT